MAPSEFAKTLRITAGIEGAYGHETLVVRFLAPVQATLMADFDKQVHDTALAVAHQAGYVPEGEAIVTITTAVIAPFIEGVHRLHDMEDIAVDNAILSGNVVEVKSEWLLFVSLL